MSFFVCPKPTALTTIPNPSCPQGLGQIQKVIFQRKSAGWVFDSMAAHDFLTLASWTPLLTAVNDTKVVVTPFLDSFVIPGTAAITAGGNDNTTINGRKLNVAGAPTTADGEARNISGEIQAALQALSQEGEDAFVAFFINQFNQLIGNDIYPGHPGERIAGIPVYSVFCGDASNEGFAKDDKTKLTFQLDYGWRNNLFVKKPAAFLPLVSLVGASET